jgi:hypothetical protein
MFRFQVLDKRGNLKTIGERGITGTTGATGATGAAGASGRVTLFDSTLSGTAAAIDTGAGGIAAGSNNLEITILARSNEALVGARLGIMVNNDGGNNYDREGIRGDNATPSTFAATAQPDWPFTIAGASCAANVFSVIHLWIPCYTQTVAFKAGIGTHSRVDTTAANSRIETQGLMWRSTAAITRLSITALAPNLFIAGTRLLIVGV